MGKSFKAIEQLTEQEREMLFYEAIKKMDAAEKEIQKKRKEIERLTVGLLAFDSESLGAAVKCYITAGTDLSGLTETAYKAYQDIAKIQILELEC